MKPLSTVASAVAPSSTLAIDALFKQMKADGIDVVGFGAGEPDFPTPEHIKQAAVRAIAENKTKYTAASGTIELKEAICRRMLADYGLHYDAANVFTSSGAKHVVYLALCAILNPGDEVILPAPFWVSYIEMVRLAGGVPVVVETTEEEHFKLSPEKLAGAITDKTKCLMLNNPSNPTGMLYTEAELRALADVCMKHDLYVIADEIYATLVYDDCKFTSFPTLGEDVKEHTILINGVSKAYAMTGWRIGYALANRDIAGIMGRFASHSTGSASTISQWAAVAALDGPQDEVESMRQAFEQRRNYLVERINALSGVSCLKPQGAFYVMMNVSGLYGRTFGGITVTDGDSFADAFLHTGLVAVVPGSGFWAPDYVRWSYATGMDTIEAGCDRLEKFLKG